VLIDGEIADGGGDLTVVSLLLFEFTVLFDVESVTIGSTAYADVGDINIYIIKLTAYVSFLIMKSPYNKRMI